MDPVIEQALCMVVLTSAAVSDVRTRHVSDVHWIVMFAVGVPTACVSMSGYSVETATMYATGAVLTAIYMFSSVCGIRAFALISAALSLFTMPLILGFGGGGECAATGFVCVFFFLLYAIKAVGGADAKCLATLSVVFPGIPPASVVIFVVAVASTSVWGMWMVALNIRAGDFRKGMLTSVRRPLDSLDTAKWWPCERSVGGRIERCRPSPESAEKIVNDLRKSGEKSVPATPVVPFILPIAVACAICFVTKIP